MQRLPRQPPEHFDRYRPYGFIKIGLARDEGDQIGLARNEGDPIAYRFFNPDGTVFEIDNYSRPTAAYREEFARAGFASFDWVMPAVSAEGLEAFPPGFWDAYLDSPPIVSLKATAA